MKYTVPAEQDLIAAMQRNLLRMAQRRGFVWLRQPQTKEHLTTPELKYLEGQEVVAINCTYLGDTLGVIALFRDRKTPFSEEDIGAIKTMAPLFAIALAKAVRGVEGAGEEQTPVEGGAETKERDEDDDDEKGRTDPADWWKKGKQPPF